MVFCVHRNFWEGENCWCFLYAQNLFVKKINRLEIVLVISFFYTAILGFRYYLTRLKIHSKTEIFPLLASVPMKIAYHLDFLLTSLKFETYLHHGSVGRVQSAIFYVRLLFRCFLLLFVLRFYHFHFFC